MPSFDGTVLSLLAIVIIVGMGLLTWVVKRLFTDRSIVDQHLATANAIHEKFVDETTLVMRAHASFMEEMAVLMKLHETKSVARAEEATAGVDEIKQEQKTQRRLLGDVIDAARKAADVAQTACEQLKLSPEIREGVRRFRDAVERKGPS
jgi:hypothetical protein